MSMPSDPSKSLPMTAPKDSTRRRALRTLLASAPALAAARAVAAPPASHPGPAPTDAAHAQQIPAAAALYDVRMPDGRMLAPDIARIVARGELVVAMLGVDTPPFFYERAGRLQGVEVTMAQQLAANLGIVLRIDREARTFDAVVDRIVHQQADLGLSKLSRTLSRAQEIRFSHPYLRLHHGLLLNRVAFARLAGGRSVQVVMRDFHGSIGVIAQSSYASFARRNFPHASLRSYPSWSAVIQAVRSGEVDAAYRDEFEIKSVLKEDPTAALILRAVTLKDLEDTLAMVLSPRDHVLLAFINLYLEQRPEKLDIDSLLQALPS